MQLEFAKYQGAGNDFILIDACGTIIEPDSKMIARMCDRHFGIGADGVMFLHPSSSYDCTMRYYNADGSEGEMCGNGGRCFALFAYERGFGHDGLLRFDAQDGVHEARIIAREGASGTVELGMIDVHDIMAGNGWWFLNTGVPHYVEFTDNIASLNVATRGRAIRYDVSRFPEGTNVNFVEIAGEGVLRVRTYERGVEAETLACGTGAVAAAIVTHTVQQPETCQFRVHVPGGILNVAFAHPSTRSSYTRIRLQGTACHVFQGTIDTDNLS